MEKEKFFEVEYRTVGGGSREWSGYAEDESDAVEKAIDDSNMGEWDDFYHSTISVYCIEDS